MNGMFDIEQTAPMINRNIQPPLVQSGNAGAGRVCMPQMQGKLEKREAGQGIASLRTPRNSRAHLAIHDPPVPEIAMRQRQFGNQLTLTEYGNALSTRHQYNQKEQYMTTLKYETKSDLIGPGNSSEYGRHLDTATVITHEQHDHMIAEAAYYIAEHRHFEGGDTINDWLQAQRDIDSKIKRTHR